MQQTDEQMIFSRKLFGAQLAKVTEDFFGKKYRLAKGVDKAQLFRVIKLIHELRAIDYATLDQNDLKSKFNQFFDEAKKINPTKNFEKHPADLVVELSRKYLDPPSETSTLRNTNFAIYSQAAFDIARKVQDAGKVKEVYNLYENIPEQHLKEFGNHAQWLIGKLGILEKRNRRITTNSINKHLELYLDMCAHFDRIARLLIGINKIMSGQLITYDGLVKKGTSFGSNIDALRKLPHFKELVSPIEPSIRNARAHGRWITKGSEQTVSFNDLGTAPLVYSYADFVQKTRELAAAMIVSAHVDSAVILPNLEQFRDFIKS